MTPDFISLFTRPDRAWTSIRQKEDANSLHYLMHLLLLALIPSVCLFIGITYVGWSLVDEERVRLAADSAFQLCLFLYITMVLGTVIMGLFVHWMARSFDVRPSLNLCIGFIAYTITPFFVAGIAGLYPNPLVRGHRDSAGGPLLDLPAVHRPTGLYAPAQLAELPVCQLDLGRGAAGDSDGAGVDDPVLVILHGADLHPYRAGEPELRHPAGAPPGGARRALNGTHTGFIAA